MAANKVLEYGSPIQLAVPAAGSYTYLTYPIQSGAPVILRGTAGQSYAGNPVGMALVINETPISPTGNFDGFASFDADGAFSLTVSAQSAESPLVTSKVVPGDIIFANINTGTYDPTTGLFYGFILDKNPSGVPVGVALTTLAAGTTGLVTVRLKVSPQI